ncbi:MAG: protein translocase subunit SecD [Nitrospinota bacterium]|nr:protein translocase subunit SecD [Nitrospinota bacterium]
MNNPNMWRILLSLGVLGVAMLVALPLEKNINLGLDLQGGMHLIYEVQADDAVLTSVDKTTTELEEFLSGKDIKVISINRDGEDLVARFPSATTAQQAVDAVEENYSILEETGRNESKGSVTFRYSSQYRKQVYDNSISQALETLRNRIDQFGVAEPTIVKEGVNRILIQLPGVKDRARALKIIDVTAQLEFRMVYDKMSPETAKERGIPSGTSLLYEKQFDPVTHKVTGRIPYLLRKKVELTGDMLTNARVDFDQFNLPYVSITFNSEGGRIFGKLTSENVGKRMAIVLDGSVYSAPVIRQAITGGSAMIEGSFTSEEARDLALVLRAGALPAKLVRLEERSVGPSLGRDSVQSGLYAGIIGTLAVLLFMLVYYRFAGMVANVALVMNFFLLMAAMSYFGATLTLPGIAGIILTIGMAVDANILVFERIREELLLGKSVRTALDQGFGRAFLTIIDSNVTTLIAALCLFQFGTGPVKGFAVTLSIGLCASMFTAVFVSRTIFNAYLSNRRVTQLSI